ncbi:MAG: transferase [Desulfovibrio sp.]|jgi:acyl-[acyl carrier protein]--UDP-N-acetylglucosamine O-acyltransferase|nr:transferase [Desulfovibrio sp.]
MSRNVLILGNSGAARECYWLLRDVMKERDDVFFKGFLAFEGYAGELRDLADLALGSDDTYTPDRDDEFILGIGMPELRLKAFGKWKDRGARFMNLTHPTVRRVGKSESGEGNVLAHNCHISCDAALGNANYLNGSVVVGHDVRIGDGNFFAPFSIVLGNARVGSGNSFGVYSVVLAGAKIGSNNTVAPGAYVYKGCGDNCVMTGNPALNVG